MAVCVVDALALFCYDTDNRLLTHSIRHFQYIHVSVDGTFFKCLLFMTSYNTSYLGLRPVPSK